MLREDRTQTSYLKKKSTVKLGLSKTTLQTGGKSIKRQKDAALGYFISGILTPLYRNRKGKAAVRAGHGQNGKGRTLISTADPSSKGLWMKGQSTWGTTFLILC